MGRNGYDKTFNPCAVGYQQLSHAFAYAGKEESGTTSCGRMSYSNWIAYSYSTPIAHIMKSKKTKEKIMLMTNSRYSNTTAKQKSMLERAFYGEIIYVDCIEKYHDFDINHTISNYNDRLKELIQENKFTRQANRGEFVNLYDALEQINEHVKSTKKHLKYTETVEKIRNNNYKEVSEKTRERQRKEREKIEKNLQNIFKELPTFSQQCEYAFGDWMYNFDFNPSEYLQRKLHLQLQKYIQPDKTISIIWFEDDELKTSQGLSFNKEDVCALLRLWKVGKLKHGMQIQWYTVLEVQKDYIKVGCHKITTDNLNKLYDECSSSLKLAS